MFTKEDTCRGLLRAPGRGFNLGGWLRWGLEMLCNSVATRPSPRCCWKGNLCSQTACCSCWTSRWVSWVSRLLWQTVEWYPWEGWRTRTAVDHELLQCQHAVQWYRADTEMALSFVCSGNNKLNNLQNTHKKCFWIYWIRQFFCTYPFKRSTFSHFTTVILSLPLKSRLVIFGSGDWLNWELML